MGHAARLHHYRARRLRSEELQHLPPRELLVQHRFAARRGSVHLETTLRNVDADDANLVPWTLPFSPQRTPRAFASWRIVTPWEGVRPLHRFRNN